MTVDQKTETERSPKEGSLRERLRSAERRAAEDRGEAPICRWGELKMRRSCCRYYMCNHPEVGGLVVTDHHCRFRCSKQEDE